MFISNYQKIEVIYDNFILKNTALFIKNFHNFKHEIKILYND